MRLVLVTPPVLEPVTLAQAKLHIKLDSGTLADNTTLYSCIAAGSHPVVTDYTLLGAANDVLGHAAVVFLQPINNGAGGTVDVKIQESDDGSTAWTDWTGGAFTQITEANDTVIQEKQYTGLKRYIRTVAKTLVAACEFGTLIMISEPISTEDDDITDDITTARIAVESDSRRALITQTWDAFLDKWPDKRYIQLPFGNLQNVPLTQYIKYTDSAGTIHTMTVTTDYIWETNGEQHGRIVLPYQGSWPTAELYPSNPIVIRFVCGYGDEAADVPTTAKRAIKQMVAKLHESRGEDMVGQTVIEDKTYDRLIALIPRLWGEF